MIRKVTSASLLLQRFLIRAVPTYSFKTSIKKPTNINLLSVYGLRSSFSTYPKHQVLNMPALSPTMTQGKVIKWLKKVGDKVQPGDILCDVQTDKATVGFQVQQKGIVAKINDGIDTVKVGTPLFLLVKSADTVGEFKNYTFGSTNQPSSSPSPTPIPQSSPKSSSSPSTSSPSTSTYPKHNQIKMPALSPTMTQGKILKWNLKVGQSFTAGTSLCSVETDKATVQFQANQKGFLAKIISPQATTLPVGQILAISVKNKDDVDKFKDYQLATTKQAQTDIKIQSSTTISNPSLSPSTNQNISQNGQRVFASPAARTLANSRGIDINLMKGLGSGPDGRIIKQDVEGYQAKQVKTVQKPSQPSKTPVTKKITIPDNPFEEVLLNGMRKTIAARLVQSKKTIPHYYISLGVTMDAINQVRNNLNKNQKQNGVKISVNDIIIKAMALALRDYPDVNAQWNTTSIKKFKHADIGVAVATDGGLITPIVFRAETLGLVQIAKRTKDIAKRAREGKLDPYQYIGGTSTISNLGMFGIDSVTSVINPPQSTIIGVGQTAKKIVFDGSSSDQSRPYKVADICELVVSADHRVVDGALAAQWLKRIQKYLQNPYDLLL